MVCCVLLAGHEDGLSCEEHGGDSSYAYGALLAGGVGVAASVAETEGLDVGGNVGVGVDGDGELKTGETACYEGEETLGIDDAGHSVGLYSLETFGGTAAGHDELATVGGEGEGSVLDGVEDVFVRGEDELDVHTELLGGGFAALERFAFALDEGEAYDASVATGYKEVSSGDVVACDECEEVGFVEFEFEVVLSAVLGVVYPEFVGPFVGLFDGDAGVEGGGIGCLGVGDEAVGDGGVSVVGEELALFVVGGDDDAVHHAAGVHVAVHLREEFFEGF